MAHRPIVGPPGFGAGGCRRGEGLDGRVGGGEEGFAGCWALGAGCERPPFSAWSRPASRSHRSRAIRSCGRGPSCWRSQSGGLAGSARGGRFVASGPDLSRGARAAVEALAGVCVVRGCSLATLGIGTWAGRSGGSWSVGSSAERMLASRWRFSAIRCA